MNTLDNISKIWNYFQGCANSVQQYTCTYNCTVHKRYVLGKEKDIVLAVLSSSNLK